MDENPRQRRLVHLLDGRAEPLVHALDVHGSQLAKRPAQDLVDGRTQAAQEGLGLRPHRLHLEALAASVFGDARHCGARDLGPGDPMDRREPTKRQLFHARVALARRRPFNEAEDEATEAPLVDDLPAQIGPQQIGQADLAVCQEPMEEGGAPGGGRLVAGADLHEHATEVRVRRDHVPLGAARNHLRIRQPQPLRQELAQVEVGGAGQLDLLSIADLPQLTRRGLARDRGHRRCRAAGHAGLSRPGLAGGDGPKRGPR